MDFPVGRLAILHSGEGGDLYLLTAQSHDKVGYYDSEMGGKCPYQKAFSSDGQWLAYVAEGDLVIGQWQGASFAQVVRSEDLAANSPPAQGGRIEPAGLNWVPGQAQLLFTTVEAGEVFPSARLDLYRYDAETGRLQRLLRNGQGGSIYPDPTGKQVALVNDNRIHLLDLETGVLKTVLEYPRILTHTEYYYTPVVDWAPDGSFFQTTVPPQDPVVKPGAPTAVWRVEAATGKAEKLGEIFAGFQARRAYFSPDGSRLAYQYLDTLDGPGKIYVAQADGSNAHLILNGMYDLEGWTSSGKHLEIYDRTARQSLGLALDGSRVQVTQHGAILMDEPLIYRPLDQQLVYNPRFLNDSYQICAWALLPPGRVNESGVKAFVPPTATVRSVATVRPLLATDRPKAMPSPKATPLPGVGEYRALTRLQRHAEAVNAVVYRPGAGDVLASAGKDGLIHLWNLPLGGEPDSLENPGGGVNGLAWSPDGAWLASAGGGNAPAVRLWDYRTGSPLRKLEGTGGPFYTAAFAPDGKLLAAAGKDGTIFVWEAASGSLFVALEGHRGAVWGLVFSADGQTLFSAGSDQTVRAWDVLAGQLSWKEDAGSRVYALALSHDGRWMAAGLEEGGVWRYDLKNGQPLPGIPLEPGAVNSLAFHPAYPVLAIGTDRGQVILFDMKLDKILNQWRAHQGWVLGLAWSPDGTMLASAGGEGDAQVVIWGRR